VTDYHDICLLTVNVSLIIQYMPSR